ncbi:hypothetical protein PAHAL_7G147200 [Panicum hallii]|uniref:non-specific serine/threonine protein kinase n=2 Tax=Panicum hallii TaxID=206008 RepID=A0A2S3I7C6_9POAL|nr:hypothetical protein PAHAL_7G147200 [Panicum hallii]
MVMRLLLLLLLLCGLLFSLHAPSCAAATDTLSRGRSLAGDKRLVSSNGKFALGFFQVGSKPSNNTFNSSYLGIWFHKVPKPTPVWSANGEHPISNLVSPELMISGDSNLAILARDTIIWSTQANITANSTVAVLLASGNLVLRSSSNSSDIFWQSFDYPTDTLLPGAKFGRNKVTGLNRRIVSRRNLDDQAPGVYSNSLCLDGSIRLSWKSSTEYWSSGSVRCLWSMEGAHMGHTHDWVTFSYSPRNQCDVYAVCGAFTICSNKANPLCYCMKGFSIRSPDDWELEDRNSGCIRNTPLGCNGSDKSTKGGCSIWLDELINVTADDNGEILYLRLAAKEVQSWKGQKHGTIISVSVGVSIVALVFIFLFVIWRSWKRSSPQMDNDQGGIGITAFRYVDMKRTTKNFTEKLGDGGFGSVFKGCLSDSVAIAVKRLDGARQGEKQFRSEVSSIGIIQNVNLVKLIGFCCEGDRRLLVYEYMPNRSLDVHLFQSHGAVLGWNIRYQIALGVARGLAYLHHSCRDCIIHCDIKPQNILLDASFTPKVAVCDGKVPREGFSRVVTTMRGTIGYLAPEWISGTAITPKVDVYSYGMVLLEIISGRRNSGKESFTDDDHARYFPVQVMDKLLNGGIGSLVDTNVLGDVNLDHVECIQDNEFDRPTMVEVVKFLEGLAEPDMPPMPRLLHAIAGGSPLM